MPGKSQTPSDPAAPARQASGLKRDQASASDHLLRQLVQADEILPWDWDLKRDRFRWAASPAWLLGTPGLDTGSYADLRDVVHADDRATFLAATQAAKEKPERFHLNIRVLSLSGATRHVMVRGHSTAEDGGKPTQINGFIAENPPQPDAVAGPPEESNASKLLNSLPDIAWLKDLKGCLICVNDAFSKRYGVARTEAPGKTDFDIYPREKAAQLRREDYEVITSRKPIRYETWQEFNGAR